MKRRKIILVILIFITLSLFIAYYIFKIDTNYEKVAGDKSFNVIFKKIGKIKEVNSKETKAIISSNRKYIYIDVPNLLVQGAYAEIPIVVKNVGNLPAKLVSITEYGLDTDGPIGVYYEGIGVTDTPILPGKEKSFVVRIGWYRQLVGTSASTRIQINLNYIQS